MMKMLTGDDSMIKDIKQKGASIGGKSTKKRRGWTPKKRRDERNSLKEKEDDKE